MEVRLARSAELTAAELERIRTVCDRAFADVDRLQAFSDDDLRHAMGGVHAVGLDHDEIVAHGAVVRRDLQVGGRPLRTGYLEGVAVLPELHGRGFGTRIVRALNDEVRARFELGALDTGSFAFYERLGWERWRGPTAVRTSEGEERTPEEDGYVMILRTPATPADLDLDAPISCEWREGDVW